MGGRHDHVVHTHVPGGETGDELGGAGGVGGEHRRAEAEGAGTQLGRQVRVVGVTQEGGDGGEEGAAADGQCWRRVQDEGGAERAGLAGGGLQEWQAEGDRFGDGGFGGWRAGRASRGRWLGWLRRVAASER